MLSLKQPLDHRIEIDGQVYEMNLSFDNVLRWYELVSSDYSDVQKLVTAFQMFVPDCPAMDVDLKTMLDTVDAIAKYLSGKDEEEVKPKDNKPKDTFDSSKEYFSFDEDVNYIFASFQQEYGIDLEAQMGILPWEKFTALLNGMRDTTQFMKIVGIRAAELPTGTDPASVAERERLIRQKRNYQLKNSVDIVEQEMNNLLDNLMSNAIIKKGGQSDE